MPDQADKDAETLLPCSQQCGGDCHAYVIGGVCCPAIYRPTVASALRKRKVRITYWRGLYNKLADRFDVMDADLTDARDEIARLKASTVDLAEIANRQDKERSEKE